MRTDCPFYTVHDEKLLLGSGAYVFLSMPDHEGKIEAYCHECKKKFEIFLKIFNQSGEN